MPRARGASFLLALVGLGETPQAVAPKTDSTCREGVLCRPRVVSKQSVAWAEEVLGRPESKLQCGQKEAGHCQKGDPGSTLAPMPGEVCVEAAALSESQQGNQQFCIMTHPSTSSAHCWEPRGRTAGARTFQRGSR